MEIVMGTMYEMPATPRGMSRARAASGPYAAELSASRPKTGIPAAAPSLSVSSSDERRGRPKRELITDMVSLSLHGKTLKAESRDRPFYEGFAWCPFLKRA